MSEPELEFFYNQGIDPIFRVKLVKIPNNKGIPVWKSYRIGRSKECEIHIFWIGNHFSRFQATMIRNLSDKNYWIINGLPNKPSANGIRVNGERITNRIQLKHGDVIQLTNDLSAIYYNKTIITENLEATQTGIETGTNDSADY